MDTKSSSINEKKVREDHERATEASQIQFCGNKLDESGLKNAECDKLVGLI